MGIGSDIIYKMRRMHTEWCKYQSNDDHLFIIRTKGRGGGTAYPQNAKIKIESTRNLVFGGEQQWWRCTQRSKSVKRVHTQSECSTNLPYFNRTTPKMCNGKTFATRSMWVREAFLCAADAVRCIVVATAAAVFLGKTKCCVQTRL